MKTSIYFLLIFSWAAFAGDNSIQFNCHPLYPPQEQGLERFARIQFRAGDNAKLEVASLSNDFTDVTKDLEFLHAGYSDCDSSASAEWRNSQTGKITGIHLVYFGSFWGATLYLEGVEFEQRCEEQPLPVAKLKFSPEFILRAVLKKMNVIERPIEIPKLLLESETPLKRFQDTVESQWHTRPKYFTNVYSVATNEIFLMDDPTYYARTSRYIDDSLAHELTHFAQVKYKGWVLEGDDSLEAQAIDVQTWFRETYL
jgi:hypothetical protein